MRLCLRKLPRYRLQKCRVGSFCCCMRYCVGTFTPLFCICGVILLIMITLASRITFFNASMYVCLIFSAEFINFTLIIPTYYTFFYNKKNKFRPSLDFSQRVRRFTHILTYWSYFIVKLHEPGQSVWLYLIIDTYFSIFLKFLSNSEADFLIKVFL